MADQTPSAQGVASTPERADRRATYYEVGLADSFQSIREGLMAAPIWWTLAQDDIRTRYRRSLLGPFWMTLSSAVTVLGLGYLWGELWRADLSEFYPYVAAGSVAWTYIASILTEAPNTYIHNVSYLKHSTAPMFCYPMRAAAKHFLLFLHQLPVVVVVVLIFAPVPTLVSALSAVGIALIAINSIWVMALLGIMGSRLRDTGFVIEAAVPLLFFMTPVIWRVNDLRHSKIIADINPFYHAIELVRAPLLGHYPSATSYFVVVGLAVVGWIATWIAFQYRRRIIFWVQ